MRLSIFVLIIHTPSTQNVSYLAHKKVFVDEFYRQTLFNVGFVLKGHIKVVTVQLSSANRTALPKCFGFSKINLLLP